MQPGFIVAGRFEILSMAGSGGMGVVYRARDRDSGRDVALKMLRRPGQEPMDRFAQEIEVLARIDHPRVVGYVTHGTTDDGAPYLVMPWLEGIDLQTRLASGPLSVDATITLARHVADALGYLHERGLVHRDLKPGNLFLQGGRVEDVRVMDFGIARATAAARPLTLSGALVGTPSFIAPEQARGDREISPPVDVFALGCVLFECLTGRRLFQGQHVMAVLAKILLEEAPRAKEFRPDVPDAVDRLIQRMVAKDPTRRPRDGAQLAAWLGDLERVPAIEGPSMQALTESERRVVSVLVVVLPSNAGTAAPSGDATWVEGGPFLAASLRFGVRVHVLGDRMAIVLAPEDVSSPDQAAILARFATTVLEQLPGATVALTTGRTLVGTRLPVGDAIDRGVAMVRSGARGDAVQVDAVTAALITSRFDVRRDGEQMILGDERRSLDPTRALLGKPTSCVGREAELAVLETMFAECEVGGGPKVLLVTAPAGAGKSRLRHEFVRRLLAQANPPMVLQARGDALRLSTPYGMVAEMVRQATGVRERQPIESVRRRLEEHVSARLPAADASRVTDFLGELVSASFDDRGDVPLRAARGDTNAMADQIGVAFADIARAWAERQPVVLVLEDLHWGDTASIKLLDSALRRLTGAPLLLLALARPEVHERVPALFANRNPAEIRLPPLSRRAASRLVEEVLGRDVGGDDAQRIVERAEGNAFYLEELIRAVAERARKSGAPPASRGRDELPETVIAVAQARLDRLEPDVRRVLRASSIFGDVFWLEGVATLVGEKPASIEPIITALIEHEAVTTSDPPRLSGVRELVFRHTLLRGAAYESLTEEDRVLGHRVAAGWLAESGEDSEVVALHWLEGGDSSRAAEYFASAAEQRWRHAQADAAARCILCALVVGQAPDATLVGARMRLLAGALKAARRLDHREVIGGLGNHIPGVAPGDGSQLVRMAIDRALAPIRANCSPDELTPILADAGRALAALSAFEDANRLVDEASVAAKGDERLLRHVRWAAATVAFWDGRYGTAWEILSQTVLPDDVRERLETLLMLATAVVCVHGREALHRGLDFVSRAETLLSAPADAAGSPDSLRDDPVARIHCAKARTACFYFTGEYAAGAESAQEAAELARCAGLRFDECAHLHNVGEQLLRIGDPEGARRTIEQSSAIARDIGFEMVEYPNAVLLAYLDGRSSDLATIAEQARESEKPWRELYAQYWLGRVLAERLAPQAAPALKRAHHLADTLQIRTMAEECTELLAKVAAT